MCGIAGILSYSGRAKIEEPLIRRMCFELKHRGPDDEGVYIGPEANIGLGHRRLSIIDLSSAGHQPMHNEDKSIWIVLNGEIYNYKELRQELEEKGHVFGSNTDTEAVVHLYEEYRESCVIYLRGMFAFAIWDEKRQVLLLARDRVGKKPLLYSRQNGYFCFASEFSSLLASGLIDRKINLKSVHAYLSFGYIPAPQSIYENIFKLPPAHILVFQDGDFSVKRYWALDYANKLNISEEEAADEILKLLREAVGLRLNSDVPLGAFLSGGIDSSTVVALMSSLSDRKVKTFSIGFEEKDYSELKYARSIAERFDTQHHEFIVKPKAIEILPVLVERYGEPYADYSCIPTYYVARETKQYVTVALNGDGGDELFAGYGRYQAMLAAKIYERLPKLYKRALSGLAFCLPDSRNPKNILRNIKRFLTAVGLPAEYRYLRWVGVFDNNSKEALYSEWFKNTSTTEDQAGLLKPYLYDNSGKLNLIDRLLMMDTETYLPNDLLVKVDIATMVNSLEARSPFLDHKLMEFAARLPAEYKINNFVTKYLLKKAIKGLLPRENITRRKMGFGMPVGEWFRQELKELLCDTLLCERFLKRGYFNPEAVKTMVKKHIEKQADCRAQLWALLMFELWHQKFID